MKKIISALAVFFITAVHTSAYGQVVDPKVHHFNIADIPAYNTDRKGIGSQLVYGATVFIPFVTMDKGTASTNHNHADEQIMILLSGRIKAYVGDDVYNLDKDDIIIIPSYIPHYVEALEDSRWIEVHGVGYKQRGEFDPDSWAVSE